MYSAKNKNFFYSLNKFYVLRSLRCRGSSEDGDSPTARRACSGLRHKDRARQGKNDVHFACRARVAPTTFWLAAKKPPAKTSCKFHVL